MKKQLSKWLSILLPIFLGLFLTIYSYKTFSPEQILEIKGYFKNANYTYIVVALIVAVLGNASRAYRWKFALEHLGYKSSFWNNLMAVNIGYLLNLTVPKSGEISRALIVKKYNNIPFDKGFGTIIAERIVDLIVLFLFMLLALFLQFDIVKTFIIDKIPLRLILLISGTGIAFFIAFILIYHYSKSRIVASFKEKIAGLKDGLFSIIHMKKKSAYFFHTLFIWGSYILMFYISTFVIPQTTSLTIGAIITAFVVGSIAIAFTNGGFGSYPFLISKILLSYTVVETAGNAFGWIVWTSQMLLILFSGLLSFLLLPVLNKSK